MPLPDWELLLSAAAGAPGAWVSGLVGDEAAARARMDSARTQLESIAGWKGARVPCPVHVPGGLDDIETSVRQLVRDEPLETMVLDYLGDGVTVPTDAEVLRIKAVLILKRNASRDYIDFVAMVDRIGADSTARALAPFDRLYRQESGESALQQLLAQLAKALPHDLETVSETLLTRGDPRWRDWHAVKAACSQFAIRLFDGVCSIEAGSGVFDRN